VVTYLADKNDLLILTLHGMKSCYIITRVEFCNTQCIRSVIINTNQQSMKIGDKISCDIKHSKMTWWFSDKWPADHLTTTNMSRQSSEMVII